jgi:hypothetical protein
MPTKTICNALTISISISTDEINASPDGTSGLRGSPMMQSGLHAGAADHTPGSKLYCMDREKKEASIWAAKIKY